MEWSKCDAKCGGRISKQNRTRKCIVGDCKSTSLLEEQDCKNEVYFFLIFFYFVNLYIYSIKLKINFKNLCPLSEWLLWNEWTTCSVTCGHGQRQRTRFCNEQKDMIVEGESDLNNNKCEGEKSVIESCILQVFLISLNSINNFFLKECEKVSENQIEVTTASEPKLETDEHWSEWLPCSVSCGIGFQLREKRCGNRSCSEKGKQARTCNIQVFILFFLLTLY